MTDCPFALCTYMRFGVRGIRCPGARDMKLRLDASCIPPTKPPATMPRGTGAKEKPKRTRCPGSTQRPCSMALLQDAWPSRTRQDTQRAHSRSRALTVAYHQDIDDEDEENSEAEEDGSDDKDGYVLELVASCVLNVAQRFTANALDALRNQEQVTSCATLCLLNDVSREESREIVVGVPSAEESALQRRQSRCQGAQVRGHSIYVRTSLLARSSLCRTSSRQCVEAANAMGKDDTQPDDLIRAMNDLFGQRKVA